MYVCERDSVCVREREREGEKEERRQREREILNISLL